MEEKRWDRVALGSLGLAGCRAGSNVQDGSRRVDKQTRRCLGCAMAGLLGSVCWLVVSGVAVVLAGAGRCLQECVMLNAIIGCASRTTTAAASRPPSTHQLARP